MVVLFLLLVMVILLIGTLCSFQPKCPDCGCKMNGSYESFRVGIWKTIYYCPHCHKEHSCNQEKGALQK